MRSNSLDEHVQQANVRLSDLVSGAVPSAKSFDESTSAITLRENE